MVSAESKKSLLALSVVLLVLFLVQREDKWIFLESQKRNDFQDDKILLKVSDNVNEIRTQLLRLQNQVENLHGLAAAKPEKKYFQQLPVTSKGNGLEVSKQNTNSESLVLPAPTGVPAGWTEKPLDPLWIKYRENVPILTFPEHDQVTLDRLKLLYNGKHVIVQNNPKAEDFVYDYSSRMAIQLSFGPSKEFEMQLLGTVMTYLISLKNGDEYLFMNSEQFCSDYAGFPSSDTRHDWCKVRMLNYVTYLLPFAKSILWVAQGTMLKEQFNAERSLLDITLENQQSNSKNGIFVERGKSLNDSRFIWIIPSSSYTKTKRLLNRWYATSLTQYANEKYHDSEVISEMDAGHLLKGNIEDSAVFCNRFRTDYDVFFNADQSAISQVISPTMRRKFIYLRQYLSKLKSSDDCEWVLRNVTSHLTCTLPRIQFQDDIKQNNLHRQRNDWSIHHAHPHLLEDVLNGIFKLTRTRLVDLSERAIKFWEMDATDRVIPITHYHQPYYSEPPPQTRDKDGLQLLLKRIDKVDTLSTIFSDFYGVDPATMLAPGARMIYLDWGARSYDTSVAFFKNTLYPNGETFDVYAFELDPTWADSFRKANDPKVTFINYGVGTKNGTFRISDHSVKARPVVGSGGMQVKVLDLSEWMFNNIKKKDFVVCKMDIEVQEYDLIPAMIKSGSIKLCDEMFIECHCYEFWRNGNHKYWECLQMFSSIMKEGLLTHEWF